MITECTTFEWLVVYLQMVGEYVHDHRIKKSIMYIFVFSKNVLHKVYFEVHHYCSLKISYFYKNVAQGSNKTSIWYSATIDENNICKPHRWLTLYKIIDQVVDKYRITYPFPTIINMNFILNFGNVFSIKKYIVSEGNLLFLTS